MFMTKYNVEFKTYDFIDDGVNYGYFVGANLDGFTINGEVDAQNEEINEVFAEFGVKIDYRQICLDNFGYIDTWNSKWNGDIDELFYHDKKDADFVAKTLQNLINPILVQFNK